MKSLSINLYHCSNCGAQFSKWIGRCLECSQWGTVEKSAAAHPGARGNATPTSYPAAKISALGEIGSHELKRLTTPLGELNRVLGGGIVPGSLVLLGGEPGIGKSTLAIQIAAAVPKSLYFSGEESVEQIKLRANRLRLASPELQLSNESRVESIAAAITEHRPALVIVDSVQTMFAAEADGETGSVTQVKASAAKLLEIAKQTATPIIIVGHVTKDGLVAGPKTLEHLVDAVLYLEGERHHQYRILRTVKNRFGPTDEVGVFAMEEQGLVEVQNPSAAFLAERGENPPGNVLTCLIEGTRPILVEVQALVTKTAFGYPVRKASGFDLNRLHVLVAVLQKRAGLHLEQYDIHLNVVGGLEANEPASDLAVCIAIASAFKDKALGADLAVFGEVGLGGEVRSVNQSEKRLKECEQLGLKRAITHLNAKVKTAGYKIKILNIKNIQELILHT